MATNMANRKIEITRKQIEDAVIAFPSSMYKASQFLGVTYTSFIRYAKKEGLYSPNPGGKGVSKSWPKKRELEYYLVKNKTCNTARLKNRLYESGLKKEECEECSQGPGWNGKKLIMHLDHIDGDPSNNTIENLRILCPNCHSQTETYCRGQSKQKLNTLVGAVDERCLEYSA